MTTVQPELTQPSPARWPLAMGFAVTIAVLYVARSLVIPLALAVLLSMLLTPVVRHLERRIPRAVAALMVVCCSAIAVGAVVWLLEARCSGSRDSCPSTRPTSRRS